MSLAEVHVEWSVILMDLLGPDIFPPKEKLCIVGERAHLKVPDWSLVWSELVTKNLPMFFSRLIEIIGGCEKIVTVSKSLLINLKFLRMTDLTAWWRGWNLRVNGMRSVFPSHPFVVLTVVQFYGHGGSPLEQYGILDVWWMRGWIQKVTMWIDRFVVNTSA